MDRIGGGVPVNGGFASFNFATGPTRLRADPTDPSRLYAVFTDRVDGDVDIFVYISEDSGAEWMSSIRGKDMSVDTTPGNTPGLMRTIDVENQTTNSFDRFIDDVATFNSDDVTVVDLDMNNNFIDYLDANGEVKVKVGWKSPVFTLVSPWEVRIDRVGLSIN